MNPLASQDTGDICQAKVISEESSDYALSPENTPSVGDVETVPENFSDVLSGLSVSLTLKKKDYMLFARIKKELQTDTSMEVGLRCIAELDILGTGLNNTVTLHPNPFTFAIHAGYKSSSREKSRGAQRLVLVLKHDCSVPSSWRIIFRIRSRMRSATVEPDALQYPRACPHVPTVHVHTCSRRVRSAHTHGYYVYCQLRWLTVLECRPTCTTVVHHSTSVL